MNFRVVKEFVARVRERALGADLLTGLNPGQQVVKIVHDELVSTLGGERRQLALAGRPSVLMLVGLQGSGKTTTVAKLGVRLRKEGKRPLLVAADVYRPAAVDQLVQLGDQIGVEVHSRSVGTPALEVARSGLEAARQRNKDLIILDTAGRLHVDDAMMDELVRIAGAVTPAETLLVVDAMTGQEAVRVAGAFHARLPLTGLVLTKMDGDARGGAALSIRSVTGIPIVYLGTGERPDGLEAFHPDRLAQRILGMGDVLSLVERVQENVDREEAERVAQRMMDARFSLEDFRGQLEIDLCLTAAGDSKEEAHPEFLQSAAQNADRLPLLGGQLVRMDETGLGPLRLDRSDPTRFNAAPQQVPAPPRLRGEFGCGCPALRKPR